MVVTSRRDDLLKTWQMKHVTNFHIQDQIQQLEVIEQVEPVVDPDDRVTIVWVLGICMTCVWMFPFLSVYLCSDLWIGIGYTYESASI